jgi:site-specific recombinase
VDDYRDFCVNDGGTQTLAHILSECRKYNLRIHMAHQTLGQIQSRVEATLGNVNVNVKVVFVLDYEDAKIFAHKLFVDYVSNINREQATIP